MRLLAFFIEILPLAGFYLGFHWGGIFMAAMISSILGMGLMGFAWWQQKRVALFPFYSVILAVIFTALAIMLEASIFIKIQPTVFNGGFAVVLLGGIMMKTAMMKRFFEGQFDLDEPTWMSLSFRWGIFFAVMAVANEVAWRNLDDAGWVWVKTFIFAPVSGLFMLAQLPLTLRGRIKT